MTTQVLSINQMRELQKLGVDTSRASMYIETGYLGGMCFDTYHVNIYGSILEDDNQVHTFTLQDILELLPKTLTPKAGEWGDQWQLLVSLHDNEIWYWYADYDCRTISFKEDGLIQSAFEMLKWVATNGYLPK